MQAVLLGLVPLLGGGLAFALRSALLRRVLLLATATIHLMATISCWQQTPEPLLGGWLVLDDIGLLFLTVVSFTFLCTAVYTVGYLARETTGPKPDFVEGFLFRNEPESVFIGCMHIFLAAATAVTFSQHFGLLWVSLEMSTLATAPLIYFHRHHRSLEALWKYLLLCSVGIALALCGNFLLAVAAFSPETSHVGLTVAELSAAAPTLRTTWLQAAFLFFVVGYGTKMGLAPLHNWLPDTYSESPSIVPMLSTAMLNCVFLGILRVHSLCILKGCGDFSAEVLQVFGIISIVVAAVFILRQRDFKRMLAYSSVEHVGIITLGVGLGGVGVFGGILHAINHALVKAPLFMVAGNVLHRYGTKQISQVQGLFRKLPVSGTLWVVGFLAITGSPPFGTFLSELTVLKAALDHRQYLTGAVYVVFLGLIFIGMSGGVLQMLHGQSSNEASRRPSSAEPWWSVVPAIVMLGGALWLGISIPERLSDRLKCASLAIDVRLAKPEALPMAAHPVP
jgi:hydrogenase-4 component F